MQYQDSEPKMNNSSSDCISELPITERVDLARKVGMHLGPMNRNAKKRDAAIRIARALISDLCTQVRETLAFELRTCPDLPKTVIAKIVCDIDDIAVPFLRISPALTDELMAELVPLLSDNAQLTVASREDIGEHTCKELMNFGERKTILALLGNPGVKVDEDFVHQLNMRFEGDQNLMNTVAKRDNISLSIIKLIIDKVSEHFRNELVARYGIQYQDAGDHVQNSAYETIWKRLCSVSPAQIHAQVIDLRANKQLPPELILAMAERGSASFLESSLALEAGKTLLEIRETLQLGNPRLSIELIKAAGIPENLVPNFLKAAKLLYHNKAKSRGVGKPALWQRGHNNRPVEKEIIYAET